jgi:hypothetical protein
MKTTLLILVITGLAFFLSCNKNSDAIEMKQVTSSSKVDTVIFAIDTLQYNFGNFGAKDELSVIKHPSHAKLFELTDQQATNKVLYYAPQNEYLGIDSVIVLSKRISEETEPVIKIDSTLFIIRTVKNLYHKNLIGKWILVQRCGGFMGRCDSVDRANTTEIEFDYNMVYTERHKGTVVMKLNYNLIDSVEIVPGYWRPRVPVYGVYSDIEFDFYFEYYGDVLVQPGNLSYIYSKLKE